MIIQLGIKEDKIFLAQRNLEKVFHIDTATNQSQWNENNMANPATMLVHCD
jgi:hypothetical protein